MDPTPTKPTTPPMRLRMYGDESGTAGSFNEKDPDGRYFALAGVAIPQGDAYRDVCERFERLKRDHLPLPHWADRDEAGPCILHREDIVARRAPHFVALRDEANAKKFNEALLKELEATKFVLYSVVLDKKKHHEATYRSMTDDYHYCIEALLERFCGRMARMNNEGDVLTECRGGSQDRALKEAFNQLATNGGRYLSPAHRARLTSKQIKVKPKASNIIGLQIADLLARDIKRELLASKDRCKAPKGFGAELVATVQSKYNRHLYNGRIAGYGQVFLE